MQNSIPKFLVMFGIIALSATLSTGCVGWKATNAQGTITYKNGRRGIAKTPPAATQNPRYASNQYASNRHTQPAAAPAPRTKAQRQADRRRASKQRNKKTLKVAGKFLGAVAAEAARNSGSSNSASAPPPRKTYKKSTVRRSSERTLTLNGRTYTGGEALGRSCNNVDRLCPSDYACHYQSVNATSGLCVPMD